MTLTEKIARIREAKNLSKADIAKALNLDYAYYFRLEKKGNKLTYEQTEAIAGALGVTVVELITYGDEPNTGPATVKRVQELEEKNAVLQDRLKDKELINKSYAIIIENSSNILTQELFQMFINYILGLDSELLDQNEDEEERRADEYMTRFSNFWSIEDVFKPLTKSKVTKAGVEFIADNELAISYMDTGLIKNEFFVRVYQLAKKKYRLFWEYEPEMPPSTDELDI